MLRNPGAYAGAALLRPVMALAEPPQPDLGAKPVLVVGGLHDPFFSLTVRVAPYLRRLGADVRDVVLGVGHDLSRDYGEGDAAAVSAWLRNLVGHSDASPPRLDERPGERG